MDVEERTIRVEEEWYEKTMLLALDQGDSTTPTERALIAREEDETKSGSEEIPTRKSKLCFYLMCNVFHRNIIGPGRPRYGK